MVSEKRAVLVVDDMAVNRRVLSKLCDRAGFEVEQAQDGMDAVAAVTAAAQRGETFSCVLMDLNMPRLDGWAATQQLRRMESGGEGAPHGRTPIVACTAEVNGAAPANCLAEHATASSHALMCGVDEVCEKPMSYAQLVALLQRHVPSWQPPTDVLRAVA